MLQIKSADHTTSGKFVLLESRREVGQVDWNVIDRGPEGGMNVVADAIEDVGTVGLTSQGQNRWCLREALDIFNE
jgi:hypothetical protein